MQYECMRMFVSKGVYEWTVLCPRIRPRGSRIKVILWSKRAKWYLIVNLLAPRIIMGGSLGGRLPECFYHVYSKRRVTRLRMFRVVAYLERITRNGFAHSRSDLDVWKSTKPNFRIIGIFSRDSSYLEFTLSEQQRIISFWTVCGFRL